MDPTPQPLLTKGKLLEAIETIEICGAAGTMSVVVT